MHCPEGEKGIYSDEIHAKQFSWKEYSGEPGIKELFLPTLRFFHLELFFLDFVSENQFSSCRGQMQDRV